MDPSRTLQGASTGSDYKSDYYNVVLRKNKIQFNSIQMYNFVSKLPISY